MVVGQEEVNIARGHDVNPPLSFTVTLNGKKCSLPFGKLISFIAYRNPINAVCWTQNEEARHLRK